MKLPWKKSGPRKKDETAHNKSPKSCMVENQKPASATDMKSGLLKNETRDKVEQEHSGKGKKSILSRAGFLMGRGVSIIRGKLLKSLPRIGKKKPEKTGAQASGGDIAVEKPVLSWDKAISAASGKAPQAGTQGTVPIKEMESAVFRENNGQPQHEKPSKTESTGSGHSMWNGIKSFFGRGTKLAGQAAKSVGNGVSHAAGKAAQGIKNVRDKLARKRWAKPVSEIGRAAFGSSLAGRIFFTAKGIYDVIIQAFSKDFRKEVTKNIIITIITSLSRWTCFVILIWGAHILAARNGESPGDWVACAMLFLIIPYYFTFWYGCLAWYVGAVRKDKRLMFHPLDLVYTYIYNRVNSEFPRFLRVIPLLSGKISRDIIDKAMEDPILWLNVGVSLALYLTGWILYIVFYDKALFQATGIHFKYIWEPFTWPFMALLK